MTTCQFPTTNENNPGFTPPSPVGIRSINIPMRLLLLSLISALCCLPAFGQHVAIDTPGARTNGYVLLPNQWSLHPAGKQLIVGDFPVNIAVHPDGKFAAVLHSGNSENEVVVFEIAKNKIISRAE